MTAPGFPIDGKGRRVLVTGGSGAIGQLVVRQLLEIGAIPIIYDVSTKFPFLKDKSDRFVTVQGDVRDVAALEEAMRAHSVAEVIHLAKLIAGAETSPLDGLLINVYGSACVLEAARRVSIKRVVQTSTKFVYARFGPEYGKPGWKPVTEDYPKTNTHDDPPYAFYVTTNKMAEYFGVRFVRKYGMELVVLRFAHTYGPGKAATRPKLLKEGDNRSAGTMATQMFDAAFKGEPYEISEGGDETDDFVYNADLADGIVRAALSNKINFLNGWREFHFGSGRLSTLREMADAVLRRYPDAQVKVGPGDLGRHSVGTVLLDNTRAQTELGYVPQYTPEKAIAHYAMLMGLTQ